MYVKRFIINILVKLGWYLLIMFYIRNNLLIVFSVFFICVLVLRNELNIR